MGESHSLEERLRELAEGTKEGKRSSFASPALLFTISTAGVSAKKIPPRSYIVLKRVIIVGTNRNYKFPPRDRTKALSFFFTDFNRRDGTAEAIGDARTFEREKYTWMISK